MSALRAGWIRLLNVFRRPRLDRDLDAELAAHLDLHTADNLRAGMTPNEARRHALLKLGGLEQTRENYRDSRGLPFVETTLQDLRFALRTLRKSPAFTAVAILTLALGIGANTAIFSVFYGVLLRPLPYPNPGQIVRLHEINEGGGQPNFSDPNFEDLREQCRSLQAVAQYSPGPQTVSVDQTAVRVTASSVSRDFFRVMGVQPFIGRAFLPEEQQFNAAATAIVSYSFWKMSLGGSTDFSSVHLRLGNQSASVVGVMPPGFRFPENADIWLPREIYERYPSRSAHNWPVVGRLAQGVSISQSRSELSAFAHRLTEQYGQDTSMTDVAIQSLRSALTGNVGLALIVLLAASTFFMLIACGNVVNLMLAQAAVRERELSLRAALGAGSGRLVRQFLTEALLLCLLGGTLGVVVAFWGLAALLRIAPTGLPRLEEVSISSPVLFFSLAVAVLIAAGMGIACAWKSALASPRAALNEGNKLLGNAPHRQLLLRVMIAGQLVTAMVLLIGAGLMGRSLLRVLAVDPGFKIGNAVTMELDVPGDAQPGGSEQARMSRRVQLLDQLSARLRAIPGVEAVGGSRELPLFSGKGSDGTFVVMNPSLVTPNMQQLIRRSLQGSLDSDPALLADLTKFFEDLLRSRERLGEADYRVVSPGFFGTLGIPLLKGRLFDERDGPDAPHVALISESLARAKWPDQDPLGQSLEFGNMDGDLRLLTIVGVVADIRDNTLEAPPLPIIYVNYRQRPRAVYRFSFVMRASSDSASVFSAAREAVRSLDPQIAPRFNSLSQVYSSSLEDRRFSLTLIAIFSTTALFLAMAGIYGVNAYSVAQRTREIGVRTALGASAKQILDMILKEGIFTAVIAIVFGALASLALTRWIRSLLFEVSPVDPITFFGIALLLLLAVLFACYLPARRATRIHPAVALRTE